MTPHRGLSITAFFISVIGLLFLSLSLAAQQVYPQQPLPSFDNIGMVNETPQAWYLASKRRSEQLRQGAVYADRVPPERSQGDSIVCGV